MELFQVFLRPTFDSFDSHTESSYKGMAPQLLADPSNVQEGDDLYCRSHYHWYGVEEKWGSPHKKHPTCLHHIVCNGNDKRMYS